MARLIFAAHALADLQRLVVHARELDPDLARRVVPQIREAVSLLGRHPLIGRPAEDGLRELVISRGKTGYVALYEFRAEANLVIVLAIRHQREVGFLEE